MESGTGNLWTFLPFSVGCSQQISTVPTPSNGGNPGVKVLHISTVPTPSNGGNPGIKDSLNSPLSQQIGVRSSKTSQCGSANRPSVVPQGSPRVLVPF